MDTIPLELPLTPLLDQVNFPADLQQLSRHALPQLAEELRAFLLYSVGQTGGHFGAGLGVIELTIALHYCFDVPNDALIWDVGHQTYPHKILTGRKALMSSLRQRGGLKGFPSRAESPYDLFGVGHSSTSISAALGFSIAHQLARLDHHAVAVIGDGAMSAGMAFEALNHAGHANSDVLVVLNDNSMSISENVGGLSHYFARIKSLVSSGSLFEDIGFHYSGPIDGHDVNQLIDHVERIKQLKGPRLLHVATQKGKGFLPAEKDPIGYHAFNKIEPAEAEVPVEHEITNGKAGRKYSDIFGDWLCEVAQQDPRLVGITPAMCEGSGMVAFSRRFPERYHDVAIAEQHSVTLAAGLACAGQKPVVAIYSTFLQRGYDQVIHDVAIQQLDVLFAIDRAGLVGEDGPTHAGVYDMSFLRCIPNMVIMAPSNEREARNLLYTGYCYPGPAAVRYPRGKSPGREGQDQVSGQVLDQALVSVPIGKAKVCRTGDTVAILAFGAMVSIAATVAEQHHYTLVDMRFIKPLDVDLIVALCSEYDLLVTIEENAIAGGAGSAVNELLVKQRLLQSVDVLNLGIPDGFIEHGTQAQMRDESGLSAEKIEEAITQRLTMSTAPGMQTAPSKQLGAVCTDSDQLMPL